MHVRQLMVRSGVRVDSDRVLDDFEHEFLFGQCGYVHGQWPCSHDTGGGVEQV